MSLKLQRNSPNNICSTHSVSSIVPTHHVYLLCIYDLPLLTSHQEI
jgi:hypothetical protein